MELVIPSVEAVCERLLKLTSAQVQALAHRSGISFSTIDKIRRGITPNPGVNTIAALLPHIEAAELEAPRKALRRPEQADPKES